MEEKLDHPRSQHPHPYKPKGAAPTCTSAAYKASCVNDILAQCPMKQEDPLRHPPEIWYNDMAATKNQFTTYERDAESGNDYAMARTYINRLGRFSSPDPLAGDISDPQSLDRYDYVEDDPAELIDPSGLCPRWGPFLLPFPGKPGLLMVICTTTITRTGVLGFLQDYQVNFSGCPPEGDCWSVIIPAGPPVSLPIPCDEMGTVSPDCPGGNRNRGGGLLGGNNATIRAGDPNAKKNDCSHQADQAALESLLPGITRGEYVPTAVKVSADAGVHLALAGAATSDLTLHAIRAKTGIPMTTASKLLDGAAVAVLAYDAYEAMRAAQKEYKACMAD